MKSTALNIFDPLKTSSSGQIMENIIENCALIDGGLQSQHFTLLLFESDNIQSFETNLLATEDQYSRMIETEVKSLIFYHN